MSKAQEDDGVRFDVCLSSLSPETAGHEVVNRLFVKGFCVAKQGFPPELFNSAVDELRKFEVEDRWQRPHPIIREGLLGAEGSSAIAELENPESVDGSENLDRESLRQLDDAVSSLYLDSLEDALDRLGIQVSHRTLGVIHKADENLRDEVASLSEREVTKWLSQFLRHRIMVLVFLGPSSGILELQPYATEDTVPHEVHTEPGTMVILRPDILSHRHFATGKSFALSSFFLAGHLCKRPPAGGWRMVPAAKQLDEWTVMRLQQLKERDRDDAPWDPDLPRDWQHAMNHMYHKGQMIAVRGAAVKTTACEDPELFWQVGNAAPDFPTEVPISRWDHSGVYDPDPGSHRHYKSYCRHGSFMDGIELFDCKFFSLTPNEAKTMDPHQRLILEVGYQSLFNMGMRKGTLVGAQCGVYVGCGNTEWNMTDKDADFGAFGATGGALSISSGRFSFILGLKGPSMTLDTEAASGATSLYLAAEACQKKGRATASDLGCAIAAHVLLTAVWWPSQCASGWLSASGRCLTFDASADGYSRADGVAAAGLKALNQVVDGEVVQSNSEPLVGSIAGAMMNNNGQGASLANPHGPAEQEAIVEAIRNASITPQDVDGVEAHAAGNILADAIEVGSFTRTHRSEDVREPLSITSMKSSVGHQVETSSLAAFIKTLYSSQWGSATPNVHLRQANPHVDAFDTPCCLSSECVEYRMSATFLGVMSRGFGGSNVYILAWGQMSDEVRPLAEKPTEVDIHFWPGGGGDLSKEQAPQSCYKIVGTWGVWQNPQTMEEESEGIFAQTVMLGENRWEKFQIWLDGDSARRLHPNQPRAVKDTPAVGPEEVAPTLSWMIEGRGPPSDPAKLELHDPSSAASCRDNPDEGVPGDQYRVRLHVVGKWRSVSWEKLSVEPSAWLVQAGRYYIVGDWNGWQPQEMEHLESSPGAFYFDLRLRRFRENFHILRDGDWDQTLYPANGTGSPAGSTEVLGPDDLGITSPFVVFGKPHEVYRVELIRRVHERDDFKRVSWTISA